MSYGFLYVYKRKIYIFQYKFHENCFIHVPFFLEQLVVSCQCILKKSLFLVYWMCRSFSQVHVSKFLRANWSEFLHEGKFACIHKNDLFPSFLEWQVNLVFSLMRLDANVGFSTSFCQKKKKKISFDSPK